MLKLILPSNLASQIEQALIKAGRREVGGLLMAEHVGANEFVIREVTIHRQGTFASFIRHIHEVWSKLSQFFDQTQHDYARFNYIGEWHSHPSFDPSPSAQDHWTMREIIADRAVGANFVVLLVVKLGPEQALVGTVHTYLPSGMHQKCQLVIQRADIGSVSAT
jgi:proteasome lid subunit RPN8/RPN11